MAKLTIETDKDDGMNLWDALRKMLTTDKTQVNDYDTMFAPYEAPSPMQFKKDDVYGLPDDLMRNGAGGFDQPINIHPFPDQKLMMGFPPERPQAMPPINPMDTMGLPMGPQLPY